MIKPIIHDIVLLGQVGSVATPEDLETAKDLLETLIANKDGCVGLAANMIGVPKKIIAFDNSGSYMVMFNPEIVKKSGKYQTEESCLSLEGARTTTRYKEIKVKYQTMDFQWRMKNYTGFVAQIIQHEIDHCNGIII